ncbi:MAG: DUF433 domain-containing protein [Dehalococcoidia bacterium]
MSDRLDPMRGVYDGQRAAALAGVPKSTLHYWARTGLVAPSISTNQPRLWSWADLLALRAVEWLRHRPDGGSDVPVRRIRAALALMSGEGRTVHDLRHILVSGSGQLFFGEGDDEVAKGLDGQLARADILVLVAPFGGAPDLLSPRPHLRIVPGKLHGEPHIEGTRIQSQAIFALHAAGYALDALVELYPDAGRAALAEAIALEQSFQHRAA